MPDIPWSKVTGMRHRLIHDYFQVDTAMVWKAATTDLLELKPKVEALLQQLGGSSCLHCQPISRYMNRFVSSPGD